MFKKLEDGIFDVPIMLSAPQKKKEEFYRQTSIDAQQKINNFAKKHNWYNLVQESFIDKIEIYDRQEDLYQRLRGLHNLEDDFQLPDTICAFLEKKILAVVTPELYAKIYPQGQETDCYTKLFVHEIAHRLHIRILKGDEEKMGPQWFFEGFAIYVADQFANSTLQLSSDRMKKIVSAKEQADYETYKAVFCYYLDSYPLNKLLSDAGKEDFVEEYIKSIE